MRDDIPESPAQQWLKVLGCHVLREFAPFRSKSAIGWGSKSARITNGITNGITKRRIHICDAVFAKQSEGLNKMLE